MAMFSSANVAVHGGSFLNVVNEQQRSHPSLDRLFVEVAPNAILNAGGRVDEVRCFPGTREEVIGKLEKFMDNDSLGKKRMMWLSGPAGAGKSAICQTVAERRSEQGQQAVNFFFFRGDSTRSRSKPLVATLIYQLRAYHPALNELLSGYLTEEPLICSTSIEKQFKQLIGSPFQTIQRSTPIQHQIVIIIDGLDECSNDEREQDQILVALHTLAHAENSPFLILVSSRAEPQLVRSFNRLGSSVESIFLNEDYRPEKDIRHFVVAKFADIKKDHHLAGTLGEKWPTRANIDAITDKSSGHFIYAATVMRYIEFSPESPALSLVAILQVQPSADHNPLAHLDKVYSHIFNSKAHNIRVVRLILCARDCSKSIQMLTGEKVPTPWAFVKVLELAGYTDIHVQSFFGDLTAIIKVVVNSLRSSLQLEFYHASLEDYLTDKSRSKTYYVRENEIAAELASMCLRNIHDADSIQYTVQALSQVQKPTPELTQSLLHASVKYLSLSGKKEVLYLNYLIAHIERLYWEHDKDEFKILLQQWSRFVHINNVNKFNHHMVRPMEPEASQYYKQYWMTKGGGVQDPLTLPGSASDVATRGNIQITPAKVSPNVAIGNPATNLTVYEPGLGVSSREIVNDNNVKTGTGTARQIIRLKLYYQEDIHSMTLTSDAPFSEFIDKVTAKLGKNVGGLAMKFKDQDGDKIVLRDDSDYEHAIETARQHSMGKAETKLEIWCQDSA